MTLDLYYLPPCIFPYIYFNLSETPVFLFSSSFKSDKVTQSLPIFHLKSYWCDTEPFLPTFFRSLYLLFLFFFTREFLYRVNDCIKYLTLRVYYFLNVLMFNGSFAKEHANSRFLSSIKYCFSAENVREMIT